MNQTSAQEATVNRPDRLSPDQLDSTIQDVSGMVSTALQLLLLGGPECQNGAIYILENADRRLTGEIVPSVIGAAPAPVGVDEARDAAEGVAIALDRIDATVGAMALSDADESQLRECLFSAVELIRPVAAEARRALDLIGPHCRPANIEN